MAEDRRSSRIPGGGSGIPRPATSSDNNSRPLAERAVNTATSTMASRKRNAAALDTIPEPSKRPAPGGSARPTRSAPGPSGPASSAQPAQSFQSEGAQKQPPGPTPGEETFDDIHARTGATEEGILAKKMSFRKGLKAEKKVEEMAPMIKELRAVGWHLLCGRQKAQLDAGQWRSHSETVEAEMAAAKQAWTQQQDAIEVQMKDVQGMLKAAEESTLKLTSELATAEQLVNERSSALTQAQQQLASTNEQLEAVRTTLKEKEAKIREMEDVVRQSQSYSSTLQSYNTSLQNDLKDEKGKRDEATKEKDSLQGKAAELSGQLKSLEHQLAYEQEQVAKLRAECTTSSRDVVALRTDLDSTRQERDRLLADNTRLSSELERIRSVGGKSLETLEALTNDKATLEVQLSTQQRLLGEMRQDLAVAKEARAAAEATNSTNHSQVGELSAQVSELRQALAAAEDKVMHGDMIRRKLHNIIQELKGNIRVFCRVRPCTTTDSGEQDTPAVDIPPSTDLLGAGVVLHVPARSAGMGDGPAAPSRHNFTFDKVFAPDSSQDAVFEEISELVQSALDGHKVWLHIKPGNFNLHARQVCIFAYGQTGSGKTHTMVGSAEQPGVIPRAMRQIFDTSCKLQSQGWTFTMQASMLEIYNEEYQDLLCKRKKPATGAAFSVTSSAPAASDKKHNVVHNADGSTIVSELTLVDVTSIEKVESLLAQAMERRSIASTQLNEHSSRSHMVFTLRIDGTNSNTGASIAGVLNLVDLAGSERVKESGATGQQLKEAQNINKSLSALGDVIAAIASKEKHVPFRNSKLTYLLQNCLGGDAKTLMFVNIAPSKEFAAESLCSLRFAAKVNACEINPKRQVTK